MTASKPKKNIGRRSKTGDTILRQWEMLLSIPVEPRMDSYEQIANKLNAAGYSVDPNTVRRDLQKLNPIFPFVIDDTANPHLCYWRKDRHHLRLPGLSFTESVALHITGQYLEQLLPDALFQNIGSTFDMARNTLEQVKDQNPHARWIDKVRAVPPSQPMAAPTGGNPDAYDLLMKALHDDKQVRVMYCPAHEVAPKEYLLHPLGLILRPPSLYLAASAWDYSDVLLYALHRFTQVEILDDKVAVPAGFDLDRQIEQGLADFGERINPIDPIDIELLVSGGLIDYLRETPLAVRGMPPVSTQEINEQPEADGRYRVRAKVNDTWQLHWWILSQGVWVEVVSPSTLRKDIAEQLKTAAAIYP